jgi:hypothetical protein
MQPEPEPESTKTAAVVFPPESGAFARQRSTRTCRTGSTSIVGEMSIDWTVQESSAYVSKVSSPRRSEQLRHRRVLPLRAVAL